MAPFRDDRNPGRIERPGLYAVGPQDRRRPVPRISDDPAIRCHAIIYGYLIYDFDPRTGLALPPDPVTGKRPMRLDYVGQTIRRLEVRHGEHIEDKPWVDLIVGGRAALPVILAQGMWTKQQRDDAEDAAIKRLRPRLNHDGNLDNPERITLTQQLFHRWARDDAAGRPRWVPLERRTALAQAAALAAVVGAGLDGNEPRYPLTVAWQVLRTVGRAVARWPRRAKLAVLAANLWAASTWCSAGVLRSLGWPGDYALGFSLILCAILIIAVLRGKRLRRWARRGRRRRRRR